MRFPGGFRLNFSKSGVGYSWGFKGFRVGKDAKGRQFRTVSIPGTGLYSREYLPPSQQSNAASEANGIGILSLLAGLVSFLVLLALFQNVIVGLVGAFVVALAIAIFLNPSQTTPDSSTHSLTGAVPDHQASSSPHPLVPPNASPIAISVSAGCDRAAVEKLATDAKALYDESKVALKPELRRIQGVGNFDAMFLVAFGAACYRLSFLEGQAKATSATAYLECMKRLHPKNFGFSSLESAVSNLAVHGPYLRQRPNPSDAWRLLLELMVKTDATMHTNLAPRMQRFLFMCAYLSAIGDGPLTQMERDELNKIAKEFNLVMTADA